MTAYAEDMLTAVEHLAEFGVMWRKHEMLDENEDIQCTLASDSKVARCMIDCICTRFKAL